MTQCELLDKEIRNYRKSFSVKIDLEDCNEDEIIQILVHLRCNPRFVNNNWLTKLADIIENQ